MWVKKPEIKPKKEKTHLFEDGERVKIKETGEEVTVKHWWFGNTGFTRWIAQYDIAEYPGTWFSEGELEKLNKKTSQEERKMKMKNCPKCNSKMVYSSEGLLLSDGVEVEIIVCKKCGYEETVKEEV